ncbi:MAG: tRNA (adenosine(37)-N6)-dimethylallyltransferase MiaA [Puniceicoccales bacterium]|jgi:tRNA dimethylallyltransferase|nr:tRNA (adenosine(37)-N6)-dimethylallyltransferase MiaA [Puniceicoccales bacterium]
MRSIYVIAGVTGSGKSAIAVDLARRAGGEILSCDSTQFYKNANIGTAKITKEEQSGIPHHGLDLVDLDQCFDVKQFVAYARHVLDEVWSRGKDIFVVGGSGFYLLSFYKAICDNVSVSQQVRVSVQQLWQVGGMEAIKSELLKYNSNLSSELIQNPVRALRALERCITTGYSVENMRRNFNRQVGPFDSIPKITIKVEKSPKIWETGLRERIGDMLQNGLIEEVIQLRANGLERHPTLSRAVGYREVLAFLSGCLSKEDLAERIFYHTRQLARKQRIWFRKKIQFDAVINANQSQNLIAQN